MPRPPRPRDSLEELVHSRRPSMLRNLLLVGVGVLLLAFGPGIVESAKASRLSKAERKLLKVINEARTARGLRALRIDPRLTRAAKAHTRDMLRRDYFDHGRFARRMAKHDVAGPVIAENIAWTPGSRPPVRWVVRMWLKSPVHRSNLLRPGFRRVGVGALAGRWGARRVTMVTADFAGR